MPLTYSTSCEELAYSKDRAALLAAADNALPLDDPAPFFEAGERNAGHQVTWFNWWGNNYRTALLYVGTEAEVLSRLRQLPERPPES